MCEKKTFQLLCTFFFLGRVAQQEDAPNNAKRERAGKKERLLVSVHPTVNLLKPFSIYYLCNQTSRRVLVNTYVHTVNIRN